MKSEYQLISLGSTFLGILLLKSNDSVPLYIVSLQLRRVCSKSRNRRRVTIVDDLKTSFDIFSIHDTFPFLHEYIILGDKIIIKKPIQHRVGAG